jgi:hypothetical protein
MKYIILASVLLLAACKDEQTKDKVIVDMTENSAVQLRCFDGVKYIIYGHGFTEKINKTTKQPELCTE